MELLSCHRPAASASPGNLLEVQPLRPRFTTPDLLDHYSEGGPAIRALRVLQVTLRHLKVSASPSKSNDGHGAGDGCCEGLSFSCGKTTVC